ncbi:hypothetical protein GCM10020000_33670 [Streptomyces olivoverticillatus]
MPASRITFMWCDTVDLCKCMTPSRSDEQSYSPLAAYTWKKLQPHGVAEGVQHLHQLDLRGGGLRQQLPFGGRGHDTPPPDGLQMV